MIWWFSIIWWFFAFMKPIWIPVKSLPATAMTIVPFIFYNPIYYKPKMDWVEKHEMRHVFQQRLLSPFIFLMLYLLFYVILFVYYLIRMKDLNTAHNLAYLNIPFEIDARKNGGWYP